MTDTDPTYEPIIGGHKTFSWEKEFRERGLHASANEVAAQGDMYFEGPQGRPAPGSGSPRRDRVSQSPSRGRDRAAGSPPPGCSSLANGSMAGSPMGVRGGSASPPGQYYGSPVTTAYTAPPVVVPAAVSTHTIVTTTSHIPASYTPPLASYNGNSGSPYRSAAYDAPPSYSAATAAVTTNISPARDYQPAPAPIYSTSPREYSGSPSGAYTAPPLASYTGSGSPSGYGGGYGASGSPSGGYGASPRAAVTTAFNPVEGREDPNYEPIIGGHKSHSWEKELRERGLHASANEVAAQGDIFFDGPQGNPAPGSGSPRRNRVSQSPQRHLPPGSPPPRAS